MSLTFSQTQGNGITLSYPITLQGGYFSDDDIVVEFIDTTTGVVTEQDTSTYSISSGNVIFNTAPENTVYVRIRREVTNSATYSDFQRGNSFGEDNLNNSFNQALYQVQQLADGFLPDDHYWKANVNAGDRKLTNLKDGEDEQDAVTFSQIAELIEAVDETSEYADQAEASATAAALSADEADDARVLAEAAETAAANSEANAASSETAAATSEGNAATSASNANTSATNAATSASTASTKAGEASESAVEANASKNAASTSATNAATSASEAETSATNAGSSATSAATSESNAATSASNAAISESNAADSEDTCQTIVDNAADQLLIDLLANDGSASGLDADTVDTFEALELMGRTDSSKGTSADPNTVDSGYIISNHVNTPWDGAWWVIHTMQVHDDLTKKAQLAIRTDETRLFIRQHDGTSWYDWSRCDNDYRVTNLGSISTTGTWTITDCVVNRPLIITGLPTGTDEFTSDGASVRFRATSGADIAFSETTTSRFALSAKSAYDLSSSCSAVMIATSDTVVMEITAIDNMTLYAYT